MTLPHEAANSPAVPAKVRRALVLYDGQCALCQRSLVVVRRLDWFHVLGFVDVRDPLQMQGLRLPVPPERLLDEMHLLPPDGGRYYHGFGAFRWMAWRLPVLWLLAPLLYLPGMDKLGQWAYLWVARHRFRLLPCHGGVCKIEARPPDS